MKLHTLFAGLAAALVLGLSGCACNTCPSSGTCPATGKAKPACCTKDGSCKDKSACCPTKAKK